MRSRVNPSVSLWVERGDAEIEVTATYEPESGGRVIILGVDGPDGEPFTATEDELQRLAEAAAEEEGERATDAYESAQCEPDWGHE